jgi:hypothetical protein
MEDGLCKHCSVDKSIGEIGIMLSVLSAKTSHSLMAVFSLSFLAFSSESSAENSESMRIIVETANQLCQAIPLEHSTTGLTLNADGRAKVGGAIGKLADLGAEGAANF